MLELLSLRKGTTLTKECSSILYGGIDEPELKIIGRRTTPPWARRSSSRRCRSRARPAPPRGGKLSPDARTASSIPALSRSMPTMVSKPLRLSSADILGVVCGVRHTRRILEAHCRSPAARKLIL